jgi:phosphate transport system substrate-binding protein
MIERDNMKISRKKGFSAATPALKMIGIVLALILTLGLPLVGCDGNSGNSGNSGGGSTSEPESFTGAINVVTREDSSGTRSAFVELFGVQEEIDGKKVDAISATAITTNSTAVMLTTVAGDERAIGYISLGSLNSSVKAVQIDGVDATTANAASGAYAITRPFNVVTTGTLSEPAQDFMNFIMSAEGQAVIEANHYIAISSSAAAFTSNGASGKVVVAGSSSVSPVMEKLIEAYATANPNVEIELQTSDSGTGISMTTNGTCDIGMASRALKDSEIEGGCKATQIAIDGIAVIVSPDNPIESLTKEQVRDIFLGTITDWEELEQK